MKYDLAILNGNVYIDGSLIKTNLYVKNGKIENISNNIFEAVEEYNAGEKYVLPGLIDPHVHFKLDLGKYISRDDFNSGTLSAAYGGITTIIDFLDPVDDYTKIETAFKKRHSEVINPVVDYSFHATAANPKTNLDKMIDEIKKVGISSLKIFTTYSESNRRTYDKEIIELLKLSKEKDFLLLVHAEDDDLIIKKKDILVKNHEDSRNNITENSEISKLADFVNQTNGYLFLVHVSCGSSINILKNNFLNLINKHIFIESCPHYFYFDNSYYSKENGYLYTMTPPLRDNKEQKQLIENIDYINSIGTDHCSFLSEEKMKKFTNDIPMGIGGIEHSFPLMFSLFGLKIIDKYTKNISKIMGIDDRKGSLSIGKDADIVIFNPHKESIISKHHSKSDYNIYENISVKGEIESTILRGIFLIKNKNFQNKYIGKYLNRG
jgi:dihydropyrimidinase